MKDFKIQEKKSEPSTGSGVEKERKEERKLNYVMIGIFTILVIGMILILVL